MCARLPGLLAQLVMVLAMLSCTSPSAAPDPAAGDDVQYFQSERGRLELRTIARGLEHPWGMAFLPDRRMLVTERAGRLRLVHMDGRMSAPLAGVPKVFAQGQGGLLDVALDPDFEHNARIYLSFAEPGTGGAGTAVLRGRLQGETLQEVKVIFRQSPKVGGGNHFGSRLVFDRAGHLYITSGDRHAEENVQRLDRGQGKVYRITTEGQPAPGNPFINQADAIPTVWSFGHRNAQGAALHPQTGTLWAVEHGAKGGDELNIVHAGRNYGWPLITHGVNYDGKPIGSGKSALPGMEQPIHYWTPSIAPSGMAFYTATRFPAWRDHLFVGALAHRHLARLQLDGDQVVHEEKLLLALGERIRDVRQGPDGYLYLLTDAPDGRVLRLGLLRD